jgi:hypothetical protein
MNVSVLFLGSGFSAAAASSPGTSGPAKEAECTAPSQGTLFLFHAVDFKLWQKKL